MVNILGLQTIQSLVLCHNYSIPPLQYKSSLWLEMFAPPMLTSTTPNSEDMNATQMPSDR